MAEVKRCARCILPESYPGLVFDESGICNRCREHEGKLTKIDFKKSERVVETFFERAKRKNRKYDCVIGLSGGKDSSYAAQICVEKFGLNPLCVNFNNGFQSKEASENIRKIIDTLNVDYISFKPNGDLMKRIYRHFLFTTGEFCTPCNVGINSFVYNMAKKYNAPLVISGTSPFTDSYSGIDLYHVSPEYFENVVNGHFSKSEMKDFLHSKTFARGVSHLTGRIKYIQLPRYIKWDEREMIRILNEKTGWNIESKISTEHTDCIASPFKEYLRICEFGFSEKTQKFSALIRNGYMSREEALEKAELFESEIKEDKSGKMHRIMDMLDLSEEDVSRAILKRQGPYIPKAARMLDAGMNNDLLMKTIFYQD